jgi:integrase
MSQRQTITVGNFKVEIYSWQHPKGHSYWRWDHVDPVSGRRRQFTAATPERIVDRIRKTLAGSIEPEALPPSVRARLTHILAADPMLTGYMDFLDWKAMQGRSVTLCGAIDEFLTLKEQNRGLSERNVRSLRGDLGNLKAAFGEETKLAGITIGQMEGWMCQHADKSAKRRRNLRAAAVTLFRWARKRKYLPHEITAAEMLEAPRTVRQIPETFTPEEMKLMLDACPRDYAPWLILSAFHGLRYSELFPPYGSEKSPLMWSDIDLTRGLITVRPETSKLNERRLIPIQPGAAKWFPEGVSGRITPARPPNKWIKNAGSINSMLGELVGGWRPNALRNSFISYRAALVGLAQTALEAGNSESEARRSYHDAKSRADGEAWFAILGDGEHPRTRAKLAKKSPATR